MQFLQVLDVIEAVLNASHHPDIAEVQRYGTDDGRGPKSHAGVAVKWNYGGAASYLTLSHLKVQSSMPTPDRMPAPRSFATRAPVFVVQLLDVARPNAFQSWELVALEGIGPTGQQGKVIGGVRIVDTDGNAFLLHAVYGSGQVKEPEEDQHSDYVIPQGVKSWHLEVNAPSAEHA